MDSLPEEPVFNSDNKDSENGLLSDSQAGKKKKPFDFTKYPRRRIALLFLYLGWNYDGLVTQENTNNTIEHHILNALEKAKLIESRSTAQWTRCGRTDKGVSGFRQVGAVTVRSNDINGEGIFWPVDVSEEHKIIKTTELQYDHILNQILPQDIRILAWAPVDKEFNARFQCTSRSYVYLFPKGRLNVELMQEGANIMIGQHDFRNFCFIDMNIARLNTTYVRELHEVCITPVNVEDGPYQMFQLKVRGSGFLWHQIRCIVAVLYDIGLGHEDPSVIYELLDVEKCRGRPQYNIASDLPLCFFDASYVDGVFNWKSNMNSDVIQRLFEDLQLKWCALQTQATIVKNMLNEVQSFGISLDPFSGIDCYIKNGNHVPLMKRKRCDSLESKREKFSKKVKK